jgi:hypothetical protein
VTQTTDKSNSTTYIAIPEGDYKPMMIESGDVSEWIREYEIKKGPNAGGSLVNFEVPIEILDDELKQKLGLAKVVTRYRMILDFDASGNLDFSEGKNVKLGKLRDVLNQNDPGKPWSPSMLSGAGPFAGHVVQTSSKDNPEQKYSEISRVAKLT